MSQREDQQTVDARRTWTAPVVRRMSAGSAEDGANNSPDAGQPS